MNNPYFGVFVILLCTSYSRVLFLHMQPHEFEYTCKGEPGECSAYFGYHQINWDNPGCPWLVSCGPELGPEEVLRRLGRWVWNVQLIVTNVQLLYGLNSRVNKVLMLCEFRAAMSHFFLSNLQEDVAN